MISKPEQDFRPLTLSRRKFLEASLGLGLSYLTKYLFPLSVEASGPNQSQQFFPETNFFVRNLETPFLSGFESFGGLKTFGYPISRPYQKEGIYYQAFQRGILRWQSETKKFSLAPVMDWLHQDGQDERLQNLGIPPPIREGDCSREERLSWLNNEAIKTTYFQNPHPEVIQDWDPITFYGLPTSLPYDTGIFIIQRFENYAFQFWQKPVPGMPKGVVGILAGDYAAASGLIPQEALLKETPPLSVEASPSPSNPQSPPSTEAPVVKKVELKEAISQNEVIFKGPHLPQVAITLDDGWFPHHIENAVEIAEKYGIKLTFFLVGRVLGAKDWQAPIQRALNAGCELQNHTWSHAWLTKNSPSQIRSEIKKAQEAIFNWTKGQGNSGRYLRPPFGAYNSTVIRIAHELDLEVVMWSSSTGGIQKTEEGNLISSEQCLANLQHNTGWGTISLLHTNWNDVGALDFYIPWLKETNLSPVLLSELLS